MIWGTIAAVVVGVTILIIAVAETVKRTTNKVVAKDKKSVNSALVVIKEVETVKSNKAVIIKTDKGHKLFVLVNELKDFNIKIDDLVGYRIVFNRLIKNNTQNEIQITKSDINDII